jgi:hypothetical protein
MRRSLGGIVRLRTKNTGVLKEHHGYGNKIKNNLISVNLSAKYFTLFVESYLNPQLKGIFPCV